LLLSLTIAKAGPLLVINCIFGITEVNMHELLTHTRAVEKQSYTYDFSICTLVNHMPEYEQMVASFIQAGFSPISCEFLYVDNTQSNTYDAYSGLNTMLQQARGKYVVLCHQDILLEFHHRKELETRIEELDTLDPTWAIAGNAGAAGPNHIVYKVSYPDGTLANKGKLPLKVQSLDEHFIMVKNGLGIGLSGDLEGFHLYGADICLQAEVKGYASYVIDFHLLHKSKGNPDQSFQQCEKNLVRKYSRFFRPRWVQTTTTLFHLPSNPNHGSGRKGPSLFLIRMWNGLKKKLG